MVDGLTLHGITPMTIVAITFLQYLFNIGRNEPYSSNRGLDSLLNDAPSRKLDNSWDTIEPEPQRPVRTMFSDTPAPAQGAAPAPTAARPRAARKQEPEDDSAVKKFGSAKSISSAQFFGDQVTNLHVCSVSDVSFNLYYMSGSKDQKIYCSN